MEGLGFESWAENEVIFPEDFFFMKFQNLATTYFSMFSLKKFHLRVFLQKNLLLSGRRVFFTFINF